MTHLQGFWVGLLGPCGRRGPDPGRPRRASAFVFRREAMGFGDVTLMGMIGAFLGWQAAVLTFFLGPFLGLAHAVWKLLKYLKKRLSGGQLSSSDREIPYGPYLSMAAAVAFFSGPGSGRSVLGDLFITALRDILVDVGHQCRPARTETSWSRRGSPGQASSVRRSVAPGGDAASA